MRLVVNIHLVIDARGVVAVFGAPEEAAAFAGVFDGCRVETEPVGVDGLYARVRGVSDSSVVVRVDSPDGRV